MDKVVITGGGGFIGSNLINQLKNKDYEIYSITKSSQVEGVKNLNLDLTMTDYGFLKDIDPKYVICLGAISSPKQAASNEAACFETNVTTIDRMLRYLKNREQSNLKKVVLTSSCVIYKDQDKESYLETDEIAPYKEIYSLSKFFLENLAEFYRQKHELPVTVFRLTNIYGPLQKWNLFPNLIPQLFHQALIEKKIEVWNTKPVRDFTFVADAVEVISRELETSRSGLFNLSTGVGVTVGEVVEIISNLTHAPVENLNKEVSPPFRVVCNIEKLKNHLGFLPQTNIQEGLEKTYQYYKSLI